MSLPEVAWKSLLDREVALAAREKKMLEERVSSLLEDLTHERERVRELEKLLSLYSGKALSSVTRGSGGGGGGAGGSPTLPSSPGPGPTSPPSQEFCEVVLKLLAGTSEDTALVATSFISKIPPRLLPPGKPRADGKGVDRGTRGTVSSMISSVPGVGTTRLPPPNPSDLRFYLLPYQPPPPLSMATPPARRPTTAASGGGGGGVDDMPSAEFSSAVLRLLDTAGARDRSTSLLANQIMHKLLADGLRSVLPPHSDIVQGTPSGWAKKGIMGLWCEGVPGVATVRLHYPTPEPRFYLSSGGGVEYTSSGGSGGGGGGGKAASSSAPSSTTPPSPPPPPPSSAPSPALYASSWPYHEQPQGVGAGLMGGGGGGGLWNGGRGSGGKGDERKDFAVMWGSVLE